MFRGRHGAVISVLLGILAVGACNQFTSQYLDRDDKIAFSAGNAVETNEVTHVTDPWPVHAKNKNIETSGAVIERAMKKYRCGTVEVPPQTTTQTNGTSTGSQSSSTSVSTFQPAHSDVPDC
jgi:hypothetical protein